MRRRPQLGVGTGHSRHQGSCLLHLANGISHMQKTRALGSGHGPSFTEVFHMTFEAEIKVRYVVYKLHANI